MKKLIIYAGTFNGFHIGHLNILQKAFDIFDDAEFVVAIGINPAKPNTDIKERTKLLSDKLSKYPNCSVISYSCFLHELIENYENDGYKVILIRGLRNGDDLNYEANQLAFINDFKKDINTIFIRCDAEYEHISSSAIRQLESFREGSGKQYLI